MLHIREIKRFLLRKPLSCDGSLGYFQSTYMWCKDKRIQNYVYDNNAIPKIHMNNLGWKQFDHACLSLYHMAQFHLEFTLRNKTWYFIFKRLGVGIITCCRNLGQIRTHSWFVRLWLLKQNRKIAVSANYFVAWLCFMC